MSYTRRETVERLVNAAGEGRLRYHRRQVTLTEKDGLLRFEGRAYRVETIHAEDGAASYRASRTDGKLGRALSRLVDALLVLFGHRNAAESYSQFLTRLIARGAVERTAAQIEADIVRLGTNAPATNTALREAWQGIEKELSESVLLIGWKRDALRKQSAKAYFSYVFGAPDSAPVKGEALGLEAYIGRVKEIQWKLEWTLYADVLPDSASLKPLLEQAALAEAYVGTAYHPFPGEFTKVSPHVSRLIATRCRLEQWVRNPAERPPAMDLLERVEGRVGFPTWVAVVFSEAAREGPTAAPGPASP